ncbi:MAG: PrsW family glutamic-type intramembrane protease [Planctomycetota bacterium]|nr:PrsW family glutamic-type intramembrane protease [Planctomycetota bacterium]
MYEQEPWYMVLFAVAIGMVSMYAIGFVERWSYSQIGDLMTPFQQALVASTHEEGIRLVMVVALALLLPSQFNDPMDGLIYGSLIGLGMAVLESIQYMTHDGDVPNTLPPQEIIRIMGHLLMGGITGFAVGMMRMRMKYWIPVLGISVIFSMGLHLLWDVIALTTSARGSANLLEKVGAVLTMLGGIVCFGFMVVTASEWSRKVFAPDQKSRLWGWPFTLFFPDEKKTQRDAD